tara:strand:+ start:411 stop:611 length:201 start_codon:yes stop_codon:yes gene_type:complete
MHVKGGMIGVVAGSICAFVSLVCISPMGGSIIAVSYLPYILIPSIIGALIAQGLYIDYSQKNDDTQ